jgi:hypothetical protein
LAYDRDSAVGVDLRERKDTVDDKEMKNDRRQISQHGHFAVNMDVDDVLRRSGK